MEPSLLQKWNALSELSEEDVNNIAYLVVYGHRDSSLTGKCRSVMFITKDTREVYGAGWNTLIGWADWATKGLPISPHGGVYLGLGGAGAVKVSVLEGLEVDKLAVGWHIGAALTRNKTLHVWGTTREAKPLSKGIIMFVIHENDTRTSCCCSSYNNTRKYVSSDVYGVKLSKCSNCGKYATSTSLTSCKPIKPCILYKFYKTECPKCELFPCTSVTIGKYEVNYCTNCNILPEPKDYVTRTVAPIRRINLPQMEVHELSCGKSFCALWTSSNDIILIGSIGNEYYEGSANIPNTKNVLLSGMSCGGEHMAVITSLGELYTCGNGDKGQLGYEWSPNMGFVTFRNVPLQGTVAKVCCGHSTTVCLMVDGSIMCFGAGLKLTSGDYLSVNHSESEALVTPTKIMASANFIDIANSHLSNIYWAKTDASMVYTWGQEESSTHHPKLLFDVTSLSEALANEKSCVSVEVGINKSGPGHRTVQRDSVNTAEMYGNHLFSDLTLILADGEFPVHKLILYNASTYFRETLEEDSNMSILKMTHYNPTAYKSLLMYFYQVPIEDLQPADLFDMYALAVHYKETEIVKDSFKKLKAILNNDTIFTLLEKSKESDNTEVFNLCETYVKTPQFQQKLISLISDNMDQTLAILRMTTNQ